MPVIFRILICMMPLLGPWPGHAAAQAAEVRDTVSRADLIRMLGRLQPDAAVRADLATLGFAGEKLDIAAAHAQVMLRDPTIAGYIADQVLALRPDRAVPVARAQGLLWGLVDQGLGYLPLRDLRYYYQVEKVVLDAMPEPICGGAVRGTLSPRRMAEATARAAARLNTAGLRNYYRIQLRAAQLGATHGPLAVSPKRAAAAETAIFAALTRRIAGEPDAARMMKAFADLQDSGNRDACRAGRLFIDAVLAMKGRELHEALIQLSQP